MSRYQVKEIFYTLQGEGLHAGRPAVFCRFSGCNLWSGREQDRLTASCSFCDTDFVGTDGILGGNYASSELLAEQIASLYPQVEKCGHAPYVVFTGGEPALQLDLALIDAMHLRGFEVGVETNGTMELPEGIDWITVSPKSGTTMKITSGHELKLVWPQDALEPAIFEKMQFLHLFIQPKDEGDVSHTGTCTRFCMEHPCWKLSLQTHKLIGIQ